MSNEKPSDLNAEVRALLELSKQLREQAAEKMRQSAEALAEAERRLNEAQAKANAAAHQWGAPLATASGAWIIV